MIGRCALIVCALASSPLAAQTPPVTTGTGRDSAHYAVDRPIEFVHMRMEMTFTAEGIRTRTVEGRVEYTLRPRAVPARTVRLDAADIRVLAVEMPGSDKKPTFTHDDRVMTIDLPAPVAPDETFKLSVRYRVADPVKGMHFILPSAAHPTRRPMVYTQGEALETRYWLPTHDWPNQRWTSDVVITVPTPYTAVSAGILQSRAVSADGKSAAFHWKNSVPTAPHHIGIVVGELTETTGNWRGKPIRIYAPPGHEAAAKYTFHRVPEILDLYSRLTGIEFPYPGYTHVVVPDHHHGGMEHAGFSMVDSRHLTAGEDDQVSLEHTESIYISHMLAHQWFGGIVNYRSVSHAWLNEGFAILLDSTWTGQTDSPERFPCKMWETARQVAQFDRTETGLPLVVREFKDPLDVFSADGLKVYYKGAWVLQMLRHQLGEEIFWKGVAKYLADNRWRGVETADLRRALEEVSGKDLEQFFQQWVFGKGVPRLAVTYAWDAGKKQAVINVKQQQKVDAANPAFAFPLDLHFRAGSVEKTVTVRVTEASHDFTFDFPVEPDLFCVDPKGGLLKTLEVKGPAAMTLRLARQGPTAVARLMAVEALAKPAGPDAVSALQEVLSDEKEFWMVRRAAATGLGRLNTAASRQALLAADAKGIAHPRALAGAISAIGSFPTSAEAQSAILKYAAGHPKLEVQSAAVSALGRMRAGADLGTRSVETLHAAVLKPSRRNVRSAAVWSIISRDDPRSYELMAKMAAPGGDDDIRPSAVMALGYLGRRDDVRDRTRDMLTAWLNDPDDPAQTAAARALGSLGDPRAISDLERIKASGRPEEVRSAARYAVEAIQRPADPKQSTSALIERLTNIEKHNQELEARLKELQQKLNPPKTPPGKDDKGEKK